MNLNEITTEYVIPNGAQNLGEWYTGPREFTLAEAFADLKKDRIADLYRRDTPDGEITANAWNGWRKAERKETLTIGETIALWYVARCNEIYAEYLNSDMTRQKRAAKLSGAWRQITYRV